MAEEVRGRPLLTRSGRRLVLGVLMPAENRERCDGCQ